MSKISFKGSLLATTVITGVVIATPAIAQNKQDNTSAAAPSDQAAAPAGVQPNAAAPAPAPTSGNEIIITGTLIRNPNLVASAPVTVVGHDEVQLRQTNTAEEILRTIPAASPSIGSQVNNGNGGSSYVNLRGLGSARNIVLLDGVRIVPVDLVGRVDLNNIPLALVDRVDVLTGGASSTYGADAVSGVVNFVTRNNFSGMELAVSDQITQRGDGNYLRGDLTIGANFDDGRGNAVISLGYQESDPVYQGGERPWSQNALTSLDLNDLGGASSSTTTPSVLQAVPGGNLQVDPTSPTGFQNKIYQRFNFNPYNVFQVPFKRYNLFSSAHYDITDHLTVYARGMYNNNTIDTIIAPSGVFGSTVTVPFSNPFLSAAQRSLLCTRYGLTAAQCAAAAAATTTTDPNYRTFTFVLRRRTPEVGPRISDYNTKMFDFRAGIRGDITDKIGFDVFAARGISDKTQTIENYVLLSRVKQGLLATNTTTCLDPSNGCVPLNIFGPKGSITPEMARFISQNSTTSNHVNLSQARATINGDTPLQLWARNPVSFAVGAEYRKYAALQASDLLAKTPGELGGAGGAAPDIKGGFDVYEGFAEMIAPIVSDRPYFDELQVEAGIRRSHYTINAPGTPKFNTTTWKVAGSWAPVRDLKFRGAYNHAVRAPNIGELFAPVVTGLTNLTTDPCAGNAPLTNPNLAAICLAQGAPASRLGLITNPTAGQANITTGGNPNLKPETANTWTVGGVIRPRFVPRLSATVDYYNIKITDAITTPTPQDLISACFGNITAASATSPACTVIRRSTLTGQLEGSPAEVPGLFGTLSNLGKIATDGIDVTFDYRQGLGTLLGTPAKIALSFNGNWTRHNKFQATPTSTNRDCAGFYSVNCNPNSKYSFSERTTLSLGRVDLSVLWRYIGKMKFEPLALNAQIAAAQANPAGCPDPLGADPGECVADPSTRQISARSYFDFATRFNVNEHFDLTFTIQNLFDKKPPIVGNDIAATTFNSGNTFPSTYDPLGRRFAAGARIKF